MPAPRLTPGLLGGRAQPIAEEGHALAEPTRPLPKVRDVGKGRVNITYRTSEDRQQRLRRYAFDQNTTIQDIIDAALDHYLPDVLA